MRVPLALIAISLLAVPLSGAGTNEEPAQAWLLKVRDGRPPAGAQATFAAPALGYVGVHATPAWVQERVRSGEVLFAERDGQYAATGVNDPLYNQQWGIPAARVDAAWNATMGSSAVRVCVLDSGAAASHADLAGAVAQWRDFVGRKAAPYDDNGHGTHVLGILAARANNGVGVAGAAPGSTFLVGKVLGRSGTGSWSAIASGIQWCADAGADVMSLSFGGSTASQMVRDALAYARARDAVVLAASGNAGPCVDCVDYPAAFPEAVAVGCTNRAGGACAFASTGPQVDVAAPGEAVLSTYVRSGTCKTDCYAAMSGTSMSTPMAAGVAALARAAHPEWDAATTIAALEAGAKDVAAAGRDDATGWGLVQGDVALG